MDLGGLFRKSYLRAADVRKGEEGFKCTGIFPFNGDIFGDDEFAPASVTEGLEQISSKNSAMTSSATPTSSATQVSLEIPASSETHMKSATSSPESAASYEAPLISPSKVSPLPKREKQVIRRSKKGASAIITSSPFKNEKEMRVGRERISTEKKVRRKLEKEEKTKKNETKRKDKLIRRSDRKPNVLQQITSKNQSDNELSLTSDDDDDSAYCLYYSEPHTNSRSKEKWIQCMKKTCGLWANTLCANVDRYQTEYFCEFCID